MIDSLLVDPISFSLDFGFRWFFSELRVDRLLRSAQLELVFPSGLVEQNLLALDPIRLRVPVDLPVEQIFASYSEEEAYRGEYEIIEYTQDYPRHEPAQDKSEFHPANMNRLENWICEIADNGEPKAGAEKPLPGIILHCITDLPAFITVTMLPDNNRRNNCPSDKECLTSFPYRFT